ncbi:phosphatidylserine decarboxylase 1 [Nowakowskiella sp. JEL0407]|nr:phosphatidylserine decarboxylase 1 [Nowakowskiella sp. JEL0407]
MYLKIQLYATLPLRSISRLWGRLTNLTIPVSLRSPIYKLYSRIFQCNLEEISASDLSEYPTFGDFFYRSLKFGVRPIDLHSALVSPVDGTILNFGIVKDGRLEQVKGLTYSLKAFLGSDGLTDDEKIPSSHSHSRADSAVDIRKEIDESERPTGKEKYYCVIYLSPGDYHRFHAPTDWVVEKRRHFVGELFSVSPYLVKQLQNLFAVNERVALFGKWKYGAFAMVPVGATNVGSIKLNFDSSLTTNQPSVPIGTFSERTYRENGSFSNGLGLKRGEEMGGFRMGSTVVLVFDGPPQIKDENGTLLKGADFSVSRGSKVRLGQPLLNVL